jgi:hypothetical protein
VWLNVGGAGQGQAKYRLELVRTTDGRRTGSFDTDARCIWWTADSASVRFIRPADPALADVLKQVPYDVVAIDFASGREVVLGRIEKLRLYGVGSQPWLQAGSRLVYVEESGDTAIDNVATGAREQIASSVLQDVKGVSWEPPGPRFEGVACSPVGPELAFAAYGAVGVREGARRVAGIVKADGSGLRVLDLPRSGKVLPPKKGASARLLAWAPDGKQLALVQDGWPCIYDLATDQARFVDRPAGLSEGYSTTSGPCWSPSGKRLLFSVRSTGSGIPIPEKEAEPSVLYVADVATATIQATLEAPNAPMPTAPADDREATRQATLARPRDYGWLGEDRVLIVRRDAVLVMDVP